MNIFPGSDQSILVTGGTSGLGLELVHHLLKKGHSVIAMGRKKIQNDGSGGRFYPYTVDFSDLKQVADTTTEICRNHSIKIVVNNAGILSPRAYCETSDGLEYTFQVNFLAHLLIDDMLLSHSSEENPLIVATVTSPVYKIAGNNIYISSGPEDYSAIRSYSISKLYLTLMHDILVSRHNAASFRSFSFDPGTFRSGIYRMQGRWFRYMYLIAAPFMRNPKKIAATLIDILINGDPDDRMIYDREKKESHVPEIEKSRMDEFINKCYGLLQPYLDKVKE